MTDLSILLGVEFNTKQRKMQLKNQQELMEKTHFFSLSKQYPPNANFWHFRTLWNIF